MACVGAATCQQGVRDSQSTLKMLVEAMRREGFSDGILPRIHISGCPSSCGTHQIGTLGFRGGVKLVDKKPMPAYMLYAGGCDAQGAEQFGQELGMMLEQDIPAFLAELGRAVRASDGTFLRSGIRRMRRNLKRLLRDILPTELKTVCPASVLRARDFKMFGSAQKGGAR